MSGIKLFTFGVRNASSFDPTSALLRAQCIIGIVCQRFIGWNLGYTKATVWASDATLPIVLEGCVETTMSNDSFRMLAADAQEYGLIGTDVTDRTIIGCYAPSGESRTEGSSLCSFSGWHNAIFSTSGDCATLYASVGSVSSANGTFSTLGTIIRGVGTTGILVNRLANVNPATTSFLDLPATGLTDGLLCLRKGGWLQLPSTVDGTNTGTSAGLYAIKMEKGATLQCETGPADGLKGDDGRIHAVDSKLSFAAAISWAASFGGGPDMYLENCMAYFADNVTKSAVNSETALQNGVDGEIVAIGTKFKSATAVFTAAHVGRSIKISGAVNPANNNVHLITAWTSATEVILGAAVGLVNEGPGLTWGLVGTPQPIIEVARGGRVSQASGKTFNVRKPEVDPDTAVQEWNGYGYGANGAIYEHENAEVTLGTVVEAAGAAGATGLAAKIKNGSKLTHTGGAVLLGVAPLDLGGNAAPIAWPATPSSDAAAVTPQGCIVIPNVP
jgi:hypothetical protein